jgi:hypothetical protein
MEAALASDAKLLGDALLGQSGDEHRPRERHNISAIKMDLRSKTFTGRNRQATDSTPPGSRRADPAHANHHAHNPQTRRLCLRLMRLLAFRVAACAPQNGSFAASTASPSGRCRSQPARSVAVWRGLKAVMAEARAAGAPSSFCACNHRTHSPAYRCAAQQWRTRRKISLHSWPVTYVVPCGVSVSSVQLHNSPESRIECSRDGLMMQMTRLSVRPGPSTVP